jgi:hypothetical protein
VAAGARRIVTDPWSKECLSWLKNNVADVTGGVRQ